MMADFSQKARPTTASRTQQQRENESEGQGAFEYQAMFPEPEPREVEFSRQRPYRRRPKILQHGITNKKNSFEIRRMDCR
jgi:hypothetical protein